MTEDNNLIKPSNKIQEQKLGLTKSLKDRLVQIKSSLRHTLLLDLSGSMEEYASDNKTKRNILEDIVKNKLPKELKKFAFDYDCVEIKNNEFPRGGGGTALHKAFDEMHKKGIKEVILITDGYPDSETAALKASQGLKIEIIYIGPEPRPKFLEDLAKSSNGHFVTVDMLDFSAAKELENKIKGFLGA